MSDSILNNEPESKPKKIIKVFPSEIGSWEYCNIKWLFEYIANNKKVPESLREELLKK